MTKTTDLTTTAGKDQFYPTHPALAEKMIDGLDFRMIENVLEPSAGKGDLISAFLRKRSLRRYDYGREYSIDACEIDPFLRSIINYNFGPEKINEAYHKKEAARDAWRAADYDIRNPDPEETARLAAEYERAEAEYRRLDAEYDALCDGRDHVHIVHDDFLTYRTAKNYQLILMNPPFSVGAVHLLKAISMQEVSGGAVVCLLNAETIRNPYTAERMALAKKLQQYDAEIEYVEDAFSDAERPARVDVAIVRVHVPEPENGESDIWEKMRKAEEEADMPDAELEALVPGDYIEQAIRLYRTEVAATLELVRHYKRLCPYMQRKLNADEDYGKEPILSLTVGDDRHYHGFDLNKYLRTVRLKYWRALFNNKKFIGRLTSTLQKRFQETVDKMADYEFSAFNIKQVAFDMNEAMRQGVEQEILHLFDELSAEHSWYPECTQNRHYYNGWATNKAHKIGKKVILPTSLQTYSWNKEAFNMHRANGFLSDIEKVLDYLDAKPMSDGYSLYSRLNWAHTAGKNRNIDLKYFAVDIYKKGTVHIKFHPSTMPIIERLNIYASQKKGWLPPRYGKADYSNMDKAEKEVVDSFHGDGTEGSGAETYAEVRRNSGFYLADPARTPVALTAHEE